MGKGRTLQQLVRHTCLTIVLEFSLCILVIYLIPLLTVSVEIKNVSQAVIHAFFNVFSWITICVALVVIVTFNMGILLKKIRQEMNQVYHKSMLLSLKRSIPTQLTILEFVKTNEHIEHMQQTIQDMIQEEKDQKQDLVFKVSAASHDLKTPLTVIQGNSELLQYTELSEQQQQYVTDLMTAGNQMSNYINQLINYSKTYYDDKAEWNEYNLSEVIETIHQETICLLKDPSILLFHNLVTDECTIKLNLTYLIRALSNLLTNALEYADKDEKKITFTIEVKEAKVSFTIWDNGMAFPDDVIEHMGQLFYKADTTRHSQGNHYGIGLAFVKRVAQLHNGELCIEPVQEGAQVILRIPISG